jgi:beta-mannosidase
MHDRPRQFYEFGAYQSLSAKLDVWATNSTLQPQEAILELSFVDLVSSWTHQEVHRVKLQPNMSTELLSAITCEAPPGTNSSTVVIGARLLSTNNPHTVLARASDWPQPLKYALYNADPKIEVTVSGEDIRVRAARPVKCLVLSVEDDGLRKEGFTWERWQESTNVHWSDNALDLMPGDEQSVWASGLAGRHIKVAYLGHEQAFEI